MTLEPTSDVTISGRDWYVLSGHVNTCELCTSGIRTVHQCHTAAHSICKECKDSLAKTPLTDRVCSYCRQPQTLTNQEQKIANNVLLQQADNCEFSCSITTCYWRGNYTEAIKHAKTCKEDTDKCGVKSPRTNKKKHTDNDHDTPATITITLAKKEWEEIIAVTEPACSRSTSDAVLPENGMSSFLDFCKPFSGVMGLITGAFSKFSGFFTFSANSTSTSADHDTLVAVITKLKNASHVTNNKCLYECGFFSQHSEQLSDHYTTCPKVLTKCEFSCGKRLPRMELNKHYEICPNYLLVCPKECGTMVERRHVQNGDHRRECPNELIPCEYCNRMLERYLHPLHELDCRFPPIFLAGVKYERQEGAIGAVYQSIKETKAKCTHVCIPVETLELIEHLTGHSKLIQSKFGLESDSSYQRSKYLHFKIGPQCFSFRPEDSAFQINPNIASKIENEVYISAVNSCRRELCPITNSNKSSKAFNLRRCRIDQKVRKDLGKLKEKDIFLIFSDRPYNHLFSA